MEWDGQMLVLLDRCAEPLLAVCCKIVVRQEWNCQWDVRLGWCEIAVKESFVDDVQGSTATGFFEIGSHASDGVYFKVCVTATA